LFAASIHIWGQASTGESGALH